MVGGGEKSPSFHRRQISPFQSDCLQDRGEHSLLACLRAKMKLVDTASLSPLCPWPFLRAGAKVSQCLASPATRSAWLVGGGEKATGLRVSPCAGGQLLLET